MSTEPETTESESVQEDAIEDLEANSDTGDDVTGGGANLYAGHTTIAGNS